MPSVVDAIPKSRFNRAVVNVERSNLDTVCFISHAFGDVPHVQLGTFRRAFVVTKTKPDVTGERLTQAVHHRGCALRSSNDEGHLSSRTSRNEPPGEIKVWNADHMVRMQMSQEQPVRVADANLTE